MKVLAARVMLVALLGLLAIATVSRPVAAVDGTPAASAGGSAPPPGVVKLFDEPIFTLRATRPGSTAEQRARAASTALAKAAADPTQSGVRVEKVGEQAVVFVGKTPVVQLDAEDAKLAGDASLDVHAAEVASVVEEALARERRRSSIARVILSASLVVFVGLLALYLLRRVGELARRASERLGSDATEVPAIEIQSLEVVSRGTLRGTLLVALGAGRWLAQIGVLYLWLLFSLSLFDATRGYTARLTGFVVAPLAGLAERLAVAMPVAVVVLIALTALLILLRFLGLFFASVSRGETSLDWLPKDLAASTGVLVRLGVLVVSLVFVAPIVTGDADGSLARVGWVGALCVGFASVPVLATLCAGSVTVFFRRLPVGTWVELGGIAGHVVSTDLLGVSVRTADGAVVSLPHLRLLWHPLTASRGRPMTVEVTLPADTDPAKLDAALLAAGELLGGCTVVAALVRLDAAGAHYRFSTSAPSTPGREDLGRAVVRALERGGLAPGRGSTSP